MDRLLSLQFVLFLVWHGFRFFSREICSNPEEEIKPMRCEFLEGLSSVLMAIVFCVVLIMPATIVGCAEKEKVLDVETPNAEIEVERDVETGQTEVEVNRDTPAQTPAP